MALVLRLRLMYRLYMRSLFRKHALTTNIVTSGFLMWMGDRVQQKIERLNTSQSMDNRRSAKMFGVGLLEGPPHHFYYSGIDKLLPGRDLRIVASKVLADQIIAAPCFILIFFYGTGFFEGHSLKQSTEEISSNMWTVYAADWLVWPPTQFINFYLIPAPYRVLYVNVVSVLYNVFLSYIKHRELKLVEEKSITHKDEQIQTLEKRTKHKKQENQKALESKETDKILSNLVPEKKLLKDDSAEYLQEEITKHQEIYVRDLQIKEQEYLEKLPEVQRYKELLLKQKDQSKKKYLEKEPEKSMYKNMGMAGDQINEDGDLKNKFKSFREKFGI